MVFFLFLCSKRCFLNSLLSPELCQFSTKRGRNLSLIILISMMDAFDLVTGCARFLQVKTTLDKCDKLVASEFSKFFVFG